jgi:hypothetical protein
MQHLFAGYVEKHPAPTLDDLKLILPKTRPHRALETERGVEVLTHHSVLKLSSLTEKIGQLLAILHQNGRLFPHGKKVSTVVAAANGEYSRRCRRTRLRWNGQ